MTVSNGSDLQLFLNRLTRRSRLTAEEAAAILNLPTKASQVATNRDFVRVGDEVDHACLVVEGLVGRFGQNADGGRQITSLHIPGDMADLHSVVQPCAASALQALTTTTILRVPHIALRAVAARYPAVAEALWRDCMVDAAILSEWVVNVGRRDSRARAAHLLCEMAVRYEEIGFVRGEEFPFPATQTHIADALGLTPVHVNRTLMHLRGEGLIELGRTTVLIRDWDELARLGDFDPRYLELEDAPEERLRLLQSA